MPYEIETRDGIVIRGIPDDVAQDADIVRQKVARARAERDGKPTAAPAGASGTWTPDDTPGTRLKRLVSGVTQGLRDPIDAGAQMLAHSLPSPVVNIGDRIGRALGMAPGTPEAVDQGITTREREYQASRTANGGEGLDLTRALGNIVATLPIGLAGPAATASLPARMAGAAAQGGAAGALQPVVGARERQVSDLVTGEQPPDFATEKAKQVSTGAAFSAASAPIVGAIARIIRPNTRPEVDLLVRENVTPSFGQILGGTAQRVEDKLRSVPIVGDAITNAQRAGVEELNRAAYARALAPINGRVPAAAGREAVDDVHRQLSDAYNHLLPNLSFRADPRFAQELANVRQLATQLPPAQAQRFEQILQQQVLGKMTPQGNATGEVMKQIEGELGRLARGYRGDAAVDNRLLGDAVREVQSLMRQNLERMNPMHAHALQNINRGYSELVKIENAAARSGTANGVFTPAQFDAAVRATDGSVRKNAFARGNAQTQDLSGAGREVLGGKYPDSGTVGRLLMSVGASGGAAMLEPSVLTGAAAASLPYLPILRRALAVGMTQRPQAATALSQRVREIVGPAAAIGAPALYDGARN
jgi:hypothetical protein